MYAVPGGCDGMGIGRDEECFVGRALRGERVLGRVSADSASSVAGHAAEPRASFARVRMSLSRARWTPWAASKPVVARAIWSRASKVTSGLRKPLVPGKLRNRS